MIDILGIGRYHIDSLWFVYNIPQKYNKNQKKLLFLSEKNK